MLQGGVVAAFGLVRGSAQADMLQLSASNPLATDTLAQVHTVHECTNAANCSGIQALLWRTQSCQLMLAALCTLLLMSIAAMSTGICKSVIRLLSWTCLLQTVVVRLSRLPVRSMLIVQYMRHCFDICWEAAIEWCGAFAGCCCGWGEHADLWFCSCCLGAGLSYWEAKPIWF